MPQIGTFPFRMPGRALNPACQTLSRACPRQVTGPNKPTVFAGETVGFCIVRGGVKSPVCGLDVPGKGTNCNFAGRYGSTPLALPLGELSAEQAD